MVLKGGTRGGFKVEEREISRGGAAALEVRDYPPAARDSRVSVHGSRIRPRSELPERGGIIRTKDIYDRVLYNKQRVATIVDVV